MTKNYSSKLIELNKQVLALNKKNFFNQGKETVLALENSVRVINKYCIRLPSDALTQLTPRLITISRTNSSYQNKLEYKCYFYLPINSGIRESIQSEWHLTAHMAQTQAAFNACIVLFKNKELNSNLEPITKEIFYRLNHRSDTGI